MLVDCAAQPTNAALQMHLAAAPEMPSSFYWDAYCELETERSVGMGKGPIPVSKIREYARNPELRLTLREQKAFIIVIREMDITGLNVEADKAASRMKGTRNSR